ncbi:hypothetical protein LTR53_006813 [Teratosphaeriaceae sp. CCFEE 6253]|nr:hypothetical protein LTR53_006813 [Teratosphaeriaceae sp. CCFEE 6253]
MVRRCQLPRLHRQILGCLTKSTLTRRIAAPELIRNGAGAVQDADGLELAAPRAAAESSRSVSLAQSDTGYDGSESSYSS